MSTDVLVSFDTTGSMSPCIAEVRRRITQMLDKLFGSIPDLRIALISHGDYCDRECMIDVLDFTNSKNALMEFVRTTPNTNGGDSDEFYEYVLSRAMQLDWQADNKIFMLIGDAEPHKAGYYYGGQTFTISWENEASKISDMGINIYAIHALGWNRSTYFYESIAHVTNGRKLELNQFPDAIETIIAACYHKIGKLEEYKSELELNFKMNRNLANLFHDLDKNIVVTNERFVSKDRSGLIPVTPARFQVVHVDENCVIKDFVESLGVKYKNGRGFYQFMKSEIIQENKEVILRNKITGDMFTGSGARDFIGLPFGTRGQIRPHYFEDYEVFVQSTSYNRKLIGGYKFLYENDYITY